MFEFFVKVTSLQRGKGLAWHEAFQLPCWNVSVLTEIGAVCLGAGSDTVNP